MNCTLFLMGAVLLFLRSGGNRARRLLAWVILFWGLFYVLQMGMRLSGSEVFLNRDVFSPLAMVVGNLYVLVTLPYFIEVMRPGWLNWKRAALFALPYILIVACYYLLLALLNEPILRFWKMNDLIHQLPHFNVWYRFVLLFSILLYLYAIHRLIFHYQAKYRRWCRENYASFNRIDINWVNYFEIEFCLVTLNFMVLIFTAAQPVAVAHQLIIMITFGYLIYKGLFHESPYPEGFFKASMEAEEEDLTVYDDTFSDKLPGYVTTLTHWFDTAKPYLRPDFKLTDVGEVLSLNRSYLSRVFNEGLGAPFSQVVLSYRLQEVKRLLVDDKEMKILAVSEKCGFQSYSSFHQNFVKQEGMTPKQYRQTVANLP